jgi:hypothetical protein
MKDDVNESDLIETTKKLKHSSGWFLMIGELMYYFFFTKNRLNTMNTNSYALIVNLTYNYL